MLVSAFLWGDAALTRYCPDVCDAHHILDREDVPAHHRRGGHVLFASAFESLFLMCACTLCFFEICARYPESPVMGRWWTGCLPDLEWNTFRYSFDVTNCIFDTQAHLNDKLLLLQNSLWYLAGSCTATGGRLVSSQASELDWYHFV